MERSNEDAPAGESWITAGMGLAPGSDATPRQRDDGPRPWLRRTIETEIVPRLMLAHRPRGIGAPCLDEGDTDVLDLDDVERLARLVLDDDDDACAGFVSALRERGIGLEQLYLELIAPAARRLGVMWETDDCDFAQVTLGLWRLQNLMFDLSPQVPAARTPRTGPPRRALLAAVPGSQHTLGLLMVSEFFRVAGWEVWSDPCASAGDLTALVRSEWFDLVGLSVGSDGHVEALASLILTLRGASRNPDVAVMVGGAILAGRPELASEVAADLAAADAREAVERADALFASSVIHP
jgi:methanogenic corrinoid protein MtbC1